MNMTAKMKKLTTIGAAALAAGQVLLARAATEKTWTDSNGVTWNFSSVNSTAHTLTLGSGLNTTTQNAMTPGSVESVDAATIPWTFTDENDIDWTVTAIGPNAFRAATNLLHGVLTIPQAVKSIGQLAFGVTTWGDQTAPKIERIASLGGITSIALAAFHQSGSRSNPCPLAGTPFPDISKITYFDYRSNFEYTLMRGTPTINKSVTSLPERLFGLTMIDGAMLIPSSVTSVGGLVFNDCEELPGAWIAGVPDVSSGTQTYTAVDPNNLFRYNFLNEMVVLGSNTAPKSGAALTGQWQFFARDVAGGGLVLLPDNGKWDGFALLNGSTYANVVFYGFAMSLDEDAGVVNVTATNATSLVQALTYAPKFKSVFGYSTRISVPEFISLSGSGITQALVDAANAQYDSLKFSVKTQAELDAVFAAIPSTAPIAIDPAGATETIAIDTTGRSVYVLLPEGGEYQIKKNGFIIIFN